MTGPLRIIVHATLAQAEPGWRRLQETGISYGFQTFEWLKAWQEVFGEQDGVRPAIVEVRAGEIPVMLAPLGIHPRYGLRILSFLGGWLTDYHAPLLDPDFARALTPQGFLELWERIRRELPRADHIHFWRMPVVVEGVPNPFAQLVGVEPMGWGHYTRLPATYEAYEKKRGDSFLRKSRRRRRRLEMEGPLAMDIAATPEEVASIMDDLVRQKSRRHRETTGQDPYAADPRLRRFYERLGHTGTADPRGFVCRLSVGGQVVATEWAFIHRKRFLDIIPAFEAGGWRKFSPGLVMKAELIRWCIESGMEIFDLTVGEEAYKDKWTEENMPVLAYHKPLNPLGAGYLAALRLRQAAKRLLAPLRRRRAAPAPEEA